MGLRVLHIVSGDGWGGAEAIVLNLIRAQAARTDLEPCLLVLNEGRLMELAREASLPVHLVRETGLSFWKLFYKIDQALTELAPAIIHAHRYKEILIASLLARRHRARSVVTLHGYEPRTAVFDRFRATVRVTTILRLAWLAGARFVAVAENVRKRYRVPVERCVVIPNGIPLSTVAPRPNVISFRELSRAPVIGWIGRMVHVKGLTTLLDALAQMPSGSQQPYLLLVGDGPERLALENRAKGLAIAGRVGFVGFVEDARPFLTRMDLFALPSLHEGVPLALLEAMGAGVPVVAAAVGGIPEIIGDSGAACLLSSRSPTAWAAALSELLLDRERARAMAERGRRLVGERFSIESMVERYIEVYLAATS